MDPLTHFLTGACIGRAGLNRKTAYATLVAVLAAEAPDVDIAWSFAGPVEELKHHRGITHSFLGAPVVAAAMVGLIWLVDRGLAEWRHRRADVKAPPVSRQPIHWGWLYLTALIAALSHLLLDWTNTYGLRPFYPFNPRWYAGGFVYIVEPVIWALLGSAIVIPALVALIGGEIGARRVPFRGRGWAIFALTGIVVIWGWRWAEQGRARMLIDNGQIATAPMKRVALNPYPVNPFRWHAVLETDGYFQTAEVDTLSGEILSDPAEDLIFKPPATTASEAAKRTFLGHVYLDWGAWAVVRDVGPEPIPGRVQGLDPPRLPPGRRWTTIEFSDLRFGYPIFWGDRSSGARPAAPPLSGWVYIVDNRDDGGEAMNGWVQK
jgi:inner membrane protein